MNGINYKGRSFVKLFILFTFLSGDLFNVYAFYECFLNNVQEIALNIKLMVFTFFAIWNIALLYLFFNMPKAFILRKEGFEVVWNKKKHKNYLWQDVKSIKLSGIPVLKIHDHDWKRIPRYIILNEFSKEHCEMINKIEEMKRP
jgi:hypothetical protein